MKYIVDIIKAKFNSNLTPTQWNEIIEVLNEAIQDSRNDLIENLEIFMKSNEDDFDRGKGVALINEFINKHKIKII